jgi:hypothetical protein
MKLEPAVGRTIEEMRENFQKTDMYKHGDAKLVWVNEGDLSMMQFAESLLISQQPMDADMAMAFDKIHELYEE